jgi:hypothetical protein
MRIDNAGSVGIGRCGGTDCAATLSRQAASVGQAGQDASHYVADPELERLTGMVRQLPGTRAEVLQAVAQQLAQGELLTGSAASGTAAAILNAGA